MNVFFDVDGTLIGSDDDSLRPLVKETFERIKKDGHTIYVWSGVGVRWPVVERHGLKPFVTDCFLKPLWDHHNRLSILGVPLVPDFCIDDYEEIITAFGGITVKPYFGRDGKDREMERVYEALCNYTVP